MNKHVILSATFAALFVINCSISDSLSRFSDSASKSSDSIASLSNSSKSISGSLSNSSSSSSGGEKKAALYRMDVKNLTALYSSNILANNGFQQDLGKVAAKYGISNWEKYPATFIAIGEGLKKANLTKNEFDLIKKEISFANPDTAKLIQSGFDSI